MIASPCVPAHAVLGDAAAEPAWVAAHTRSKPAAAPVAKEEKKSAAAPADAKASAGDKKKADDKKKAPAPKLGVTVLSGDMSYRPEVRTVTVPNAGREARKTTTGLRLRLFADHKTKNWAWRIGVSSLNPISLESSVLSIGRDMGEINPVRFRDFQFVNAYFEWYLKEGWKIRLGRTQSPFIKSKTEMLTDNDLFWDGLWVESPKFMHGGIRFHGMASQIHNDLRFRGDQCFAMGLGNTFSHKKMKGDWRITRWQYNLVNGHWLGRATMAGAYRIWEAYGAIDWHKQIRTVVDIARNTAADIPGAGHNKGGDAINLTLILGGMKKPGRSQLITQLFQVGAHAIPVDMTSYRKGTNVQGMRYTYKYKISKSFEVNLEYFDYRRLDNAVATDKRYRRWENQFNYVF